MALGPFLPATHRQIVPAGFLNRPGDSGGLGHIQIMPFIRTWRYTLASKLGLQDRGRAVSRSGALASGIIPDTVKIRLHSWVLGIGTLICFAEVVYAPQESDPGPWLTAVLGLLLLRRAIIATPQPTVVI